MKKIYDTIWEEAIKMQDLRQDRGHARTVTDFAILLCKKLKGNEKIVIPAAILHDIGYYGLDNQLLLDLMNCKLSDGEVKRIKEEHMVNGSKLAEEILIKVNYPKEFIKEIVRIIRNHDYSSACSSKEEKIIKDADKLWRFSEKGFSVDVRRRACKIKEWGDYLLSNIEKEGYFQTQEAKNIAKKEIKLRMKNE